ncbi:MAG TPA: DCC1-like thiol-disulfide oxidoreductase family protein [Candidatus Dormibacteraeota bacterium]|nr:DCC1-like thiol-disulfide oxidoreductase family protein [Candidatus Dormibacteraeota bacterium]
MPNEPVLLIFDGTCSFCARCARLAVEQSPAGRLSALPSQTPGLLERYGIAEEEADRWVWAVAPSGRRWHGAAAVARALDAMGGGWRGLALLARLPGAGLVYAAVARTRGRLGAAWGDPPPCGR